MSRFALVLIACVALAGCGGDDKPKAKTDTGDSAVQATPTTPSPGGGGSAPASPGKARYIARIDAICRSANASLAPIRAKLATIDNGRRGKGEVFSRFQNLTGQAATISDGVLGQIESVPPPATGRAAIEQIQALLEQQSRLLHGLAAAAGRRDAREIKRLNGQIAHVSETYRARAQAFGFKYCGQGRG